MIFPSQSFIRIVSHLVVMLLFIVSLVSGIRLAFDNPYMPDQLLHLPIIPEGNVLLWHEIAAYGWLVLVAYVLVQWLKVRRSNPKHYQRKNTFIRFNYWLVLGQCATGLTLYLNSLLVGLAELNGLLLQLHYFGAALFFVVVIAHMVDQIIKQSWQRLIAFFLPKNINIKASVTLGLITVAAFVLYFVHHMTFTELSAKQIPLSTEITVDGVFDEKAWQSAQSATVMTVQGNDYFNSVPVEVKVLHNGLSAYFAIRWPDATPSYSHLPLVKTADGWQVKHQGFEKDDERQFYEDKMAVMLSQDAGLGGGYSVHLGKKPLDDKPQNRSGRGYHYTTDNSVRDIWHWKAVRSKQMSFLDDNHFSTPSPACEACPRYKAGYRTDPKDSGAFRANWTWFLTDKVTPLRLPMRPNMQQQITDGQYHDNNMSWFDTMPYTKAADTYPIGTELPSVLAYEGFEGDRANVNAKGIYKEGYWHLELARNIKHESKFDLAIENGVYLWFAPFDHAQSRHGYHLKPLKLVMKINQEATL